jgi:hypothetical protein
VVVYSLPVGVPVFHPVLFLFYSKDPAISGAAETSEI